MKLNQKGALDMMVVLLLVVVIAAGAFVAIRVADDDEGSEVANVANTESEELSDHVEVAESEIVDTENAEDDATPLEAAIEENGTGGEQVAAETPSVVDEDGQETDNTVTCGVKGGENQVTFYASDYVSFNTAYYGDVKLVKGGGDNCGILRLTVNDHYDDGALVHIDTFSGGLADAIKFEEGKHYSVCSEVRVNTSNTGYFHEFPENASRPFFIPPNKGGGEEFHTHCTGHMYTRDHVSGAGDIPYAVVLALYNNAFDEEGQPIDGEEVQSVDVRRVTVKMLEK